MIADPRMVTLDIAGKKYQRTANERVSREYTQYENARDARSREREREFENLRMYAGIDNSAWPSKIQKFMFDDQRGNNFGNFTHLGSYNFTKTKINGIAGSLARNPFDASYVADDDVIIPLTLALQEAYLSDKEMQDWEAALLQTYTLGQIYQGVIRMYARTEHPASPMGNLALECLPPGACIVDPTWKTGKSRDIRDFWTLTWMTADAIKEKYQTRRDLVERELWIREKFGEQYEQDKVDWNRDIPEQHGDRYLVVQHNYLKREKITREIDPITGTVFWEWMEDDAKKNVALENGVDPTNIHKIEMWDNVEHIFTFSPALSMGFGLLDTKARYQIGRLKYFPWCPEWINGLPAPMVDQLRDAQLEINKRVATISLAAESAVTSGDYIDEGLFGMNQQKIAEYKANKGNPRYTAVFSAGTTRAFPNGMGQLTKQQIPPDLFGITNMMVDLMDRLVPQPAASEGRTERSGESGILFAQKIEVAKTMQMTMLAGIRQLTNDLAEAYFFFAKQLYSKGKRVFTNAKGTRKTVINDTRIDASTNEEYVENDFSALPRHRVIISEAPAGVNNRLAQRELNATLMQTYAGLPLVAMTFGENLVKSIEMDDPAKERAEEAIDLERQKLIAQTIAATVNARVAAKQAESMMGAPPAGPAGAPTPPEEMQPIPENLQGGPVPLKPGIGAAPSTYPR